MCDGQAGEPGEFAGVGEAVAVVQAGLAFLASAEVAGLPGEVLAAAVRGLAGAESVHLAARSRLLGAFTAQDAPVADGHPTTKSWLRWQTRVTQGAAGAEVGWMRRLAAHPRVAAALAARAISPSWALQVCRWTDELPAGVRDDADAILLGAADGGADLADLSGLAREMRERTAPPDPDDGPPGEDEAFRDRWVRLDVTFQGAGRVEGALTPECAAALAGVLESLGRKAGPGDDRSQGQRHHDAVEEACRMLLGTGSLPDVAGQPAQMLVHATLGQLLGLAGHGDPGSGAPGSGEHGPGPVSPREAPARTGRAWPPVTAGSTRRTWRACRTGSRPAAPPAPVSRGGRPTRAPVTASQPGRARRAWQARCRMRSCPAAPPATGSPAGWPPRPPRRPTRVTRR